MRPRPRSTPARPIPGQLPMPPLARTAAPVAAAGQLAIAPLALLHAPSGVKPLCLLGDCVQQASSSPAAAAACTPSQGFVSCIINFEPIVKGEDPRLRSLQQQVGGHGARGAGRGARANLAACRLHARQQQSQLAAQHPGSSRTLRPRALAHAGAAPLSLPLISLRPPCSRGCRHPSPPRATSMPCLRRSSTTRSSASPRRTRRRPSRRRP